MNERLPLNVLSSEVVNVQAIWLITCQPQINLNHLDLADRR